jgi:hypothetical protein
MGVVASIGSYVFWPVKQPSQICDEVVYCLGGRQKAYEDEPLEDFRRAFVDENAAGCEHGLGQSN